MTPRRIVEAILAREADAGPLDSYVHDLLRHNEPELASRLRVIATTPPTPIPPLVAAPAIGIGVTERITSALLAAGKADGLAAVRTTLQLEGFGPASAHDYRVLRTDAERADALGYMRLAQEARSAERWN